MCCRWRVLVAAVAIAALMAGGGLYNQSTRAAAALTAQDIQEITQLYSTMYQGSDLRDADMWLSTLADDAVFQQPTGEKVIGRKALAEWRVKSFGGKTGDSKRRHWFGLIRALPAPNGGATVKAYHSVLDVSKKPAMIMATGTVDDVFVKTAAGWKFKVHAVYLDTPGE